MGLFADNIETAQDRWNELTTKDAGQGPGEQEGKPTPPPPPRFVCPTCKSAFDSDVGLQDHIATTHGTVFAYIRIDSRIASVLDSARIRPTTLSVVCCGEPTRVTLKGDGFTKSLIVNEGVTSLLPYLPSDFSGLLTIDIRNSGDSRPHFLTIGQAPRIRYSEMRSLAGSLQKALDMGSEPDWNGYTAVVQSSYYRNPYEKPFLDAFYDYSLGFWMERRGDLTHSAPHLERALAQLEPYTLQPMATTATRILGIRLNCFSALRSVPRTSRFHFARLFFVDNALSVAEGPDRTRSQQDSEEGVYCDGFTERLLAILKAFYARDFRNVVKPSQQLKAEAGEDRNNLDKLDLVLSRACRLPPLSGPAGPP